MVCLCLSTDSGNTNAYDYYILQVRAKLADFHEIIDRALHARARGEYSTIVMSSPYRAPQRYLGAAPAQALASEEAPLTKAQAAQAAQQQQQLQPTATLALAQMVPAQEQVAAGTSPGPLATPPAEAMGCSSHSVPSLVQLKRGAA